MSLIYSQWMYVQRTPWAVIIPLYVQVCGPLALLQGQTHGSLAVTGVDFIGDQCALDSTAHIETGVGTQ